jgi:hypothetical protein
MVKLEDQTEDRDHDVSGASVLEGGSSAAESAEANLEVSFKLFLVTVF